MLALSRNIVVPSDLHRFFPRWIWLRILVDMKVNRARHFFLYYYFLDFYFRLSWDDNYYITLPQFFHELHSIHSSNQHQLLPFHPLIWQ